MHLIVPFASAMAEGATQTLRGLGLAHLPRLLARLEPAARSGDDEYSLCPPHERAHAEAIGLRGDDGALPLAALAAAADGLDLGGAAVGLLTPVHWQVGRDHVTLADPDALALDDDTSRAVFDAVRELFESEGYTLHWGAATRWYVCHDELDGLPCASIDRVIGRNVDLWLPADPRARRIRRLQSEVQMRLYTHPLNEDREARGELPVNSFWLSGCGRPQAARPDAAQLDLRLREPALRDDWPAWAEAWRALDAGPIAELAAHAARGETVALTLCGERFAQGWTSAPRSVWQRFAGRWQATDPAPLLEAL
jgi:hypothetical protein